AQSGERDRGQAPREMNGTPEARPHRTPRERVRGLGRAQYNDPHYKEKAKMRSIKLTTVFAAASALLALAPAAASAHRGHHFTPSRRSAAGCRVTLQVAPRLVYSGGEVTASGRLSCLGSASVEGQAVTLYQGSVIAPGYSVA